MNLQKQSNELKKKLKSSKEFNQVKLAKHCNVSRSIVSQWVNGKQKISDAMKPVVDSYFTVNNEKLTTPKKVNKKSKVNKNENQTKNKEPCHSSPDREKKYEFIRTDLSNQLEGQNKYGKHYEDLVDHAVYLFKLKDDLQDDIELNGIRIKMTTGNGHEKTSDNQSIKNLNAVSAQLMRVLKGLGLDEPEIKDEYDESDFM